MLLSQIVQVVAVSGHQSWSLATRFSGLFDVLAAPALSAYVPDFSFLLDNVSHTPDDALHARPLPPLSKATLWFLKVARKDKYLLTHLEQWRDVINQLLSGPRGQEAFLTLVHYYVMVAQGLELEQILHRFAEVLGPKAEQTMLTVAQKLEARGEAKGRAEGLRMALRDVCEVFGIKLTPEREQVLATLDAQGLERLRQDIKRTHAWPA